MFFLIRTAFWVSLLLLVLPIGGDMKGEGPSSKDRASIDAMSALAAAGATVSDVGGFCGRQPEACEVGGQTLKLVGERAREATSALTGYLSSDAAEPAKPAAAGRAGAGKTDLRAAPGRQTLTASDRKPAWRGPNA